MICSTKQYLVAVRRSSKNVEISVHKSESRIFSIIFLWRVNRRRNLRSSVAALQITFVDLFRNDENKHVALKKSRALATYFWLIRLNAYCMFIYLVLASLLKNFSEKITIWAAIVGEPTKLPKRQPKFVRKPETTAENLNPPKFDYQKRIKTIIGAYNWSRS